MMESTATTTNILPLLRMVLAISTGLFTIASAVCASTENATHNAMSRIAKNFEKLAM